MVVASASEFGEGNSSIWLGYNGFCSGHESSILNCYGSIGFGFNCNHENDVGVVCYTIAGIDNSAYLYHEMIKEYLSIHFFHNCIFCGKRFVHNDCN